MSGAPSSHCLLCLPPECLSRSLQQLHVYSTVNHSRAVRPLSPQEENLVAVAEVITASLVISPSLLWEVSDLLLECSNVRSISMHPEYLLSSPGPDGAWVFAPEHSSVCPGGSPSAWGWLELLRRGSVPGLGPPQPAQFTSGFGFRPQLCSLSCFGRHRGFPGLPCSAQWPQWARHNPIPTQPKLNAPQPQPQL